MSTLQALHDLLLDRSKWPDDFVWDYGDTSHCAIGLACAAGLLKVRHAEVNGTHFGISENISQQLFFAGNIGRYNTVTPEQVAKRIAALL